MTKKLKVWSLDDCGLSPADVAEVREEVARDVLLMQLADLRDRAGLTQAQVAAEAGVAQAEISRAERRSDHLVSTLRRYVEALGGELEVVAVVGGARVTLTGV